MARPEKYTVDYFPHKVKCGRTLFIIEDRWKNNGYAFWFKLLELLGETDYHILNCNDPDSWEYLLSKSHLSDELATEILDKLALLGAIDPELWDYKYIWSDNFVENVKDAYKKRVVSVPVKPSVVDLQEGKLTRLLVSVSGNSQSKVKESKVKESKVNKEKRIKFKKEAEEILSFLNETGNKNFTASDVNLDFIIARLKEPGVTPDKCRQVIAKKVRKWKDDPKMDEFIRPATIFNKTKFNQYMGELVPHRGSK